MLKAALHNTRFIAAALLFGAALSADSSSQSGLNMGPNPNAEFQFVRLAYSGTGMQYSRRDRWLTDR